MEHIFLAFERIERQIQRVMPQSEDAHVLPYRHKRDPVGVKPAPGELPAIVMFTAMEVVFGIAAFAMLVCVLSDVSLGRHPNGELVLSTAGMMVAPLATWVVGKQYLRRLRARRLFEILYCEACGYDLRASSGQCPECGRPIPEGRDVVARRLREIVDEDE
jgi:hypothetical protein